MEVGKTYRFKDEFCKELEIPVNQYTNRREELLEWLENFFDFEFVPGRPHKIRINEIIGEYQPLPSKLPNQAKLTQQKKEDYEQFTIEALGIEFKPNSKSKVAREAITEFGYERYGHTSQEAVAKRYVKEPFERYGETNNNHVWVYYSTYAPLSEDTLARWRIILKEENIAEEQAANAFYKQEQGEDISKEKKYYKNAIERFQREYGDTPVLVQEWKVRDRSVNQR